MADADVNPPESLADIAASPTSQESPSDEKQGSPTSECTSESSGPASPAIQTKGDKIDILLKATGDAPIMKKRKWAVDKNKKVGWIIEFIRRYIKIETEESIFVYVNQAFAPAPDIEVGTLYDCFGADGKLVLHYCRTQAWG